MANPPIPRQPEIILIVGPTAVGKTKLALQLAKKYDAEIIGLDSIQIYNRLCLGSAKPSNAQLAAAKHHLVNSLNAFTVLNVRFYLEQAIATIDRLRSEGKSVIVVGGTFYFCEQLLQQTFCSSTAISPSVDTTTSISSSTADINTSNEPSHPPIPFHAKGARENPTVNPQQHTDLFEYRTWANTLPLSTVTAMVESIDPQFALKFRGNQRRLTRGLEIYLEHGLPPTQLYASQQPTRLPADSGQGVDGDKFQLRYRTKVITLTSSIAAISERCMYRVCEMLQFAPPTFQQQALAFKRNQDGQVPPWHQRIQQLQLPCQTRSGNHHNPIKRESYDENEAQLRAHKAAVSNLLSIQHHRTNILAEVYCLYIDTCYRQYLIRQISNPTSQTPSSINEHDPMVVNTQYGIWQGIGAKEFLPFLSWLNAVNFLPSFPHIATSIETATMMENETATKPNPQKTCSCLQFPSTAQAQHSLNVFESVMTTPIHDIYGLTSPCYNRLFPPADPTPPSLRTQCESFSSHLWLLNIFLTPYNPDIRLKSTSPLRSPKLADQSIIFYFLHQNNLLPCHFSPFLPNLSKSQKTALTTMFTHHNPPPTTYPPSISSHQVDLINNPINLLVYNIEKYFPNSPLTHQSPSRFDKSLRIPSSSQITPTMFLYNPNCPCVECEFVTLLTDWSALSFSHSPHPFTTTSQAQSTNQAQPVADSTANSTPSSTQLQQSISMTKLPLHLYNITLLSLSLLQLVLNTITLAKQQQKWIDSRLLGLLKQQGLPSITPPEQSTDSQDQTTDGVHQEALHSSSTPVESSSTSPRQSSSHVGDCQSTTWLRSVLNQELVVFHADTSHIRVHHPHETHNDHTAAGVQIINDREVKQKPSSNQLQNSGLPVMVQEIVKASKTALKISSALVSQHLQLNVAITTPTDTSNNSWLDTVFTPLSNCLDASLQPYQPALSPQTLANLSRCLRIPPPLPIPSPQPHSLPSSSLVNSIGEKKAAIHCQLCDVVCIGDDQMKSHLRGKNHKQKQRELKSKQQETR